MENESNHLEQSFDELRNNCATLCDMAGVSRESREFLLESDEEFLRWVMDHPEYVNEDSIKTTMSMLKNN